MFKCNICGKCFRHTFTLKFHLADVHMMMIWLFRYYCEYEKQYMDLIFYINFKTDIFYKKNYVRYLIMLNTKSIKYYVILSTNLINVL